MASRRARRVWKSSVGADIVDAKYLMDSEEACSRNTFAATKISALAARIKAVNKICIHRSGVLQPQPSESHPKASLGFFLWTSPQDQSYGVVKY